MSNDYKVEDMEPTVPHWGTELSTMPDLSKKDYADKYDIMDNNKVKLDRPIK